MKIYRVFPALSEKIMVTLYIIYTTMRRFIEFSLNVFFLNTKMYFNKLHRPEQTEFQIIMTHGK